MKSGTQLLQQTMLHLFNLAGFRFLHLIYRLTEPPNESSFSDLTKHKLGVT